MPPSKKTLPPKRTKLTLSSEKRYVVAWKGANRRADEKKISRRAADRFIALSLARSNLLGAIEDFEIDVHRLSPEQRRNIKNSALTVSRLTESHRKKRIPDFEEKIAALGRQLAGVFANRAEFDEFAKIVLRNKQFEEIAKEQAEQMIGLQDRKKPTIH